jgi:hypothetical protein
MLLERKYAVVYGGGGAIGRVVTGAIVNLTCGWLVD